MLRIHVILMALVAATLPAFGQIEGKPLSVLQGRLVSAAGEGPILRMPNKDYALSAGTSYLFHALQDKRLANREVRVEGIAEPQGTFKVQKFFTVRGGKLYRVRYFCETCNLEALEPGLCVCCQQPTELQEIPVREASR